MQDPAGTAYESKLVLGCS